MRVKIEEAPLRGPSMEAAWALPAMKLKRPASIESECVHQPSVNKALDLLVDTTSERIRLH